jgi:hypothetical protein
MAELRWLAERPSGTIDDRRSLPPLMRLRHGRSHLLLANRPNSAILKLKPRLRTCPMTYQQRPQPTVTP